MCFCNIARNIIKVDALLIIKDVSSDIEQFDKFKVSPPIQSNFFLVLYMGGEVQPEIVSSDVQSCAFK